MSEDKERQDVVVEDEGIAVDELDQVSGGTGGASPICTDVMAVPWDRPICTLKPMDDEPVIVAQPLQSKEVKAVPAPEFWTL